MFIGTDVQRVSILITSLSGMKMMEWVKKASIMSVVSDTQIRIRMAAAAVSAPFSTNDWTASNSETLRK